MHQLKVASWNFKSDKKLYDYMKNSFLIFKCEILLNFYSSPIENCSGTIAMNKMNPNDDAVLGINCFDELLLKSDLISYAKNNFSQEIERNELLFFSKRMNLYFYRNEKEKTYVKFLNDARPLFIGKSYDL